ncbi:hypothetical protein HPB48_020735 [Haemaphysalis longicornis]|uniref:Uncharacterized protein n=1 Tax=Haemaphysalis longicornis TaxID=44386 RepID=A0A9J6FZ68_HAELO|nr:hypothetical protein HPB48_020735 [Haemaphysalis longicornis]
MAYLDVASCNCGYGSLPIPVGISIVVVILCFTIKTGGRRQHHPVVLQSFDCFTLRRCTMVSKPRRGQRSSASLPKKSKTSEMRQVTKSRGEAGQG